MFERYTHRVAISNHRRVSCRGSPDRDLTFIVPDTGRFAED